MAYKDNEVGLLLKLSPKAAYDKVLVAYKRASGNTTHAAGRLGCTRSTLKRWVAALEKAGFAIRADIAQLREPEAA